MPARSQALGQTIGTAVVSRGRMPSDEAPTAAFFVFGPHSLRGGQHMEIEGATRHFMGVRIGRDERTMLEQLAKMDERSLASMIRELIRREAERRLVKAGGDDED
jgi:hypothetical protein